jgi:hypothetical protein
MKQEAFDLVNGILNAQKQKEEQVINLCLSLMMTEMGVSTPEELGAHFKDNSQAFLDLIEKVIVFKTIEEEKGVIYKLGNMTIGLGARHFIVEKIVERYFNFTDFNLPKF